MTILTFARYESTSLHRNMTPIFLSIP